MKFALGSICLLSVILLIGATPQRTGDSLDTEVVNKSDAGFSPRTTDAVQKAYVKHIKDRIDTISTLLSFGMQISGVYNRLRSSEPPNYHQKYQDYLSQITNELEGIRVNLNGVASFMGQQQPLGCSYSLAEIQILTCLRRFRAFNQSSSSTFLKQEFLKSGAELEASIEHLLAGLNGDYVINADIITVVRDELDCHQHPFNEKIGRFLALINTGLEMHANFVHMTNISVEENSFFMERVNHSYERVNYRIRQEIENCVNEINYQRDVYQVIQNSNQVSIRTKDLNVDDLTQLTASVAKTLGGKYSYRNWLVCLEKQGGNVDPSAPALMSEHFFRTSSGGFNVAALSMDRRRAARTLNPRQKEMLFLFFYVKAFAVMAGKESCVRIDPRQNENEDSPYHFVCSPSQLTIKINEYRAEIEKLIGSAFAFIVLKPLHYLHGELNSATQLFNSQGISVLIIPL